MDGPVVLDTSVILKWFRQGETLSGQALKLRDAYLDGRIVVTVPSLVAYELANVLRYKTAGKRAGRIRGSGGLGGDKAGYRLGRLEPVRRFHRIECAGH